MGDEYSRVDGFQLIGWGVNGEANVYKGRISIPFHERPDIAVMHKEMFPVDKETIGMLENHGDFNGMLHANGLNEFGNLYIASLDGRTLSRPTPEQMEYYRKHSLMHAGDAAQSWQSQVRWERLSKTECPGDSCVFKGYWEEMLKPLDDGLHIGSLCLEEARFKDAA